MTPRIHRTLRHALSRHPLSMALAMAVLALPAAPALAQSQGTELPRGGNVTRGNATISYNPGAGDVIPVNAATTIRQTSRGAVIEWGSFSISEGNTVIFDHATPGGVTLNRVVGWAGDAPLASLIAGAINAPDGTVFLVNQSGITFAGSAQVNVGGIVASTLDIDDVDFSAGAASGRHVFAHAANGDPPAAVVVDRGATLTATRPDGTIALLGGSVENNGTLTGAGGSIGLIAGQSITLDPYGDGLTQFTITAPGDDGMAINHGVIASDGGSIDLRAGYLVETDGSLNVDSSGSRRGSITLAADNIQIGQDASLDASGAGRGGSILLQAGETLVTGARASLRADGGSAGGTILTQAPWLDLRGLRVSAGGGSPGQWRIESGGDLALVPGNGTFGGYASLVSDTSVAGALSAGSDVGLQAGAAGGPTSQINIAPGVNVAATNPLPVTLSFRTPAGQIMGGVAASGASTGAWSLAGSAPLALVFDALSTIGLYGGALRTAGGSVSMGSRASSSEGITLSGMRIGSLGGSIALDGGTAQTYGVGIADSDIDSGGGDITIAGQSIGSGFRGIAHGVFFDASTLIAGSGHIRVDGSSRDGTGILAYGASLSSTGLQLLGNGRAGVLLSATALDGGTGSIGIGGIANGAAADAGVALLQSSRIRGSGDLSVSGWSQHHHGIQVDSGSRLDGGGMVVLRAGSASADALQVDGAASSSGVLNLRTGAVSGDAVVDDDTAAMVLGGLFASARTLANLDTPVLVAGHAAYGGAITVADAIIRNGDLTLQNDGGTAGIQLDDVLDTGSHTLALSSGGDIGQTANAAITTRDLLVRANGNVALDAAANHVASDTLAGSAGGGFAFLNSAALALGTVSAIGATGDSRTTPLTASGISAGGNVFVRSLAGNLTLRGNVSGNRVDLVSAGVLDNAGNASVSAADSWRIWASTWSGETRGGLAGSGGLPNLYGCTYAGACAVGVPATDNHFVYAAQPVLAIRFDDQSRVYGQQNPPLTYTVSAPLFADDRIALSAYTSATATSDTGSYAIDWKFDSPNPGYFLSVSPGTLLVTPALLTYVADPLSILMGQRLGTLHGTVTGFVNGDTLQTATTGTARFATDATPLSLPGDYAIVGSGLSARNYVFEQAPANATALNIGLVRQPTPPDYVLQPPDNYLYDLNIGQAGICPVDTPLGMKQESNGDTLGREWARVRTRPNLMSCLDSERENGCGDF